jgi:hypothetical protein
MKKSGHRGLCGETSGDALIRVQLCKKRPIVLLACISLWLPSRCISLDKKGLEITKSYFNFNFSNQSFENEIYDYDALIEILGVHISRTEKT